MFLGSLRGYPASVTYRISKWPFKMWGQNQFARACVLSWLIFNSRNIFFTVFLPALVLSVCLMWSAFFTIVFSSTQKTITVAIMVFDTQKISWQSTTSCQFPLWFGLSEGTTGWSQHVEGILIILEVYGRFPLKIRWSMSRWVRTPHIIISKHLCDITEG